MIPSSAPLPHPRPDLEAHNAAFTALLQRLKAHAMLAELADGQPRDLHAVTTPEERQLLYFEALRRYHQRCSSGAPTEEVLWVAERLLPPGVILDGSGGRRPHIDCSVHPRVHRGLVGALLQLERKGLIFEFAPTKHRRDWRVLPTTFHGTPSRPMVALSGPPVLQYASTPTLPPEELQRGTRDEYERALRQTRFSTCHRELLEAAGALNVPKDVLLHAIAETATTVDPGEGWGSRLDYPRQIVARVPGLGRVRRRRLITALTVFMQQQLPDEEHDYATPELVRNVTATTRPVDLTIHGSGHAMRIRTGKAPTAWLYRLATPADPVDRLLATVDVEHHHRRARVTTPGAPAMLHYSSYEFDCTVCQAWDQRYVLALLATNTHKTS